MLKLKPVTKENLIEITDLEMGDEQQGKGYGVQALEACCEAFKKEFPSIGCVELIHYPDNDRAAAVYEKAGFHLTGDSVKSAPGRIERTSTDPNRTFEMVRRRFY